ncbi:MAG: aldo/keto reductase [Synergistaceae bacterium]|jgi:predicted aldo/keto reductase-like oxidoreductase|nr:aldo/keto reductase [Synergistaceae bacterium]
MEKREYKKSGESVSLLGFGCMRLPLADESNGVIDGPLAKKMVDRAISMGVDYFDTAYPYHEGKSEAFIGEALKGYPRESFKLADKLPTWLVENSRDVPRLFEEQLERCQVGYFDYYLVHSLNAERVKIVEANDVYGQLKEFQAQGRIKRLGFSFHDRPEVLAEIVQKHEWDFAQIQFNYVDWEQQDAKSEYLTLKNAGVPIVVMEPVRGGGLADLRGEAAGILRNADPDASQASWAIRYAASFPETLTVLSGMSDMAQLDDNLRTMSDFRPISPYEYEVILDAVAAYKLASVIPCTSCRYCMDCPSGADIPKVIAIYNNYRRSNEGASRRKMLFELEYGILGEQKQAGRCVNCGACVSHCPQGIDIPHWMSVIDDLSKELGAA